MSDFDHRPDAAQQAGEGLELGNRIRARYGNSPGLARLPGATAVAARSGRFTAGHLPLLARLQRRWSNSTVLPRGWTDPIYAWPVFPSVQAVSAPLKAGAAPRRLGVTLRPVPIQPEIAKDMPEPPLPVTQGTVAESPAAPAGFRGASPPSSAAESPATPPVSNAASGGRAQFGRPVFKRQMRGGGAAGSIQRKAEPASPNADPGSRLTPGPPAQAAPSSASAQAPGEHRTDPAAHQSPRAPEARKLPAVPDMVQRRAESAYANKGTTSEPANLRIPGARVNETDSLVSRADAASSDLAAPAILDTGGLEPRAELRTEAAVSQSPENTAERVQLQTTAAPGNDVQTPVQAHVDVGGPEPPAEHPIGVPEPPGPAGRTHLHATAAAASEARKPVQSHVDVGGPEPPAEHPIGVPEPLGPAGMTHLQAGAAATEAQKPVQAHVDVGGPEPPAGHPIGIPEPLSPAGMTHLRTAGESQRPVQANVVTGRPETSAELRRENLAFLSRQDPETASRHFAPGGAASQITPALASDATLPARPGSANPVLAPIQRHTDPGAVKGVAIHPRRADTVASSPRGPETIQRSAEASRLAASENAVSARYAGGEPDPPGELGAQVNVSFGNREAEGNQFAPSQMVQLQPQAKRLEGQDGGTLEPAANKPLRLSQTTKAERQVLAAGTPGPKPNAYRATADPVPGSDSSRPVETSIHRDRADAAARRPSDSQHVQRKAEASGGAAPEHTIPQRHDGGQEPADLLSANPQANGGRIAPLEMVQLDARAGKPDVTPLGLKAPVWNVEARAQESAPDRIENDRGAPAPAASEARRLSQASESPASVAHRDMDHVSKPAVVGEAARVIIQSDVPVTQETARAAPHPLQHREPWMPPASPEAALPREAAPGGHLASSLAGAVTPGHLDQIRTSQTAPLRMVQRRAHPAEQSLPPGNYSSTPGTRKPAQIEGRISNVVQRQQGVDSAPIGTTLHSAQGAETGYIEHRSPGRTETVLPPSSRAPSEPTISPQPEHGDPRPLVSVPAHAEPGSPRPAMVHSPHTIQRFADAVGGPSFGASDTGTGVHLTARQTGLGQNGRDLQEVSRSSDRFVNRAIAQSGSNAGNSTAAAASHGAAEPGRYRPPAPNVDINGVADQVYQLLVRRLASERQRKGL